MAATGTGPVARATSCNKAGFGIFSKTRWYSATVIFTILGIVGGESGGESLTYKLNFLETQSVRCH